ncbi:ATP-binding protein [Fusobacterium ulcerans]|uniref:histidine kinase n=1 Tax=Fusobacterium ulcerans 12-1B TaxID=457404 RepID=H1PXJ5_9FUSO|nr:ATP-binding protein [Fusobacterium ulcerans]EHO78033.1 hypothetical protein HMPREF0402_03138 [Fusobacterium ulcerans 12-1B]
MTTISLSSLYLLKQFCISNYVECNADKALSYLSKNIHWFGISATEDIHNFQEAEKFIKQEILQLSEPYKIEFLEEDEKIISTDFGTSTIKIHLTGNGLHLLCRITAVTKKEGNQLKIYELHTSVPGEPLYMYREAKTLNFKSVASEKPNNKKSFKNNKSSEKIPLDHRNIVTVILVVIALIGAIIIFASYLMKLQWNTATSTIKTASIAGTQCVSNAISADQFVLSNIAQIIGENDSQEVSNLLNNMQKNTDFREIIAIFNNGSYFSSIKNTPKVIIKTMKEIEFSSNDSISNTYYGDTGKKQVAYRSYIISKEKKIGILYGIVDLSKYYVPSIMEFYNGKGFSYVIDAQNGDFLIYTTRTMSQGAYRDFYSTLGESENNKIISELKDIFLSGKSGSTILSMLGTKTYMYFVPIEKNSNRYLITMIPYEIMREESAGLVYIVISFITVVLLAATSILIFNIRISRTKAKERGYRNMLFHLLSENIDSVFFIYDTENKILDYVSENTKRILGIEKNEFTKTSFIHNNLVPNLHEQKQIAEAMKKKYNFHIQYPYCNPMNGKCQLLQLSGYVPNDELWQNKWIFCIDDRTDDILKERKLKQAVMEADKANSAKTEFLANMSHDIRTPMNGIIGITQLALIEKPDIDKMYEYMKKISASSSFLLSLINDILDMSKIESGKIELNLQPYSMKELRSYLESVIYPLCLDKNLNFSIVLDETKCVFLDKQRFNQILLNLLSNAIKFTNKNGKVKVSLFTQRKEKKKAHLILYVEDNGIGMSQEFQKKMFMPFTQESRKIIGMNGTGLGLAIVKKLVDIMGGKIKVESNLGTGSRFIIEMEVDIAETPKFETEAEDNNSQFNNLNGFRILLCEDNFINQEIMTNILKIMGMEVDIAVNGKQAVEKYLDHEEGYYGAILMDCRMPVMDGYEATKRIRMAHKPDAKILPIIALTADAFEEDKKHCIDVGMNDFLAKPVIIEELKKILIKNIYKTGGK